MPYDREVIDLFPYRQGRVLIARFQCVAKGRTFSLLPHQLAPYRRYTVSSMTNCLLIAAQLQQEEKRGLSYAVDALPDDCSDCEVTPWLLVCWLKAMLLAFRRAHAVLAGAYDLSAICTAKRNTGTTRGLVEVQAYVVAILGQGAGRCVDTKQLDQVARTYSEKTLQHFLGTPSQDRGRSCAQRNIRRH